MVVPDSRGGDPSPLPSFVIIPTFMVGTHWHSCTCFLQDGSWQVLQKSQIQGTVAMYLPIGLRRAPTNMPLSAAGLNKTSATLLGCWGVHMQPFKTQPHDALSEHVSTLCWHQQHAQHPDVHHEVCKPRQRRNRATSLQSSHKEQVHSWLQDTPDPPRPRLLQRQGYKNSASTRVLDAGVLQAHSYNQATQLGRLLN